MPKVNAPKSLVKHEAVKQVVEQSDKVEAAKAVTVVKEKLSRAQIMENMGLDLAKYAEKKPAEGERALQKYEAFFQLSEKEEFLKMVQSIDLEKGIINLKQGFALPILLSEKSDLYEFLYAMEYMFDGGQSPFIHLIDLARDENSPVSEETFAGIYALVTLLSYGRVTPNIDWETVEAVPFEYEYLFNGVFKAVDGYVNDPENGASLMKGMLMELIPDTFTAMSDLYQRDSFKKIGLVITSPSEGEGVLFTAGLANIMTYIMYDLFSELVPEEVEEEAEAEGEPITAPAGKEPMHSPKVETGKKVTAPVVEDEIVEDDDGIEPEYNDDDDIIEDDDDIIEDEEEEEV